MDILLLLFESGFCYVLSYKSQFQKSVIVIPAKAGIQKSEALSCIFNSFWTPAFAGVTVFSSF
ncbi:MAG: hypothetical protein C0403_05545 [Desulfobacterium sp.]|nr:hypothetical protein [Desulfobacterium sp.]